MNIVGLVGTAACDPKITTLGTTKVVNFLIKVQGAGDWNKTEGKARDGYFAVEAWGNLASTLEDQIKKGSNLSISGTLKQSSWFDAEGNSKEKIKVVITSFFFVPIDPSQFQNSDLASIDDEDEEGHPYDPFAV